MLVGQQLIVIILLLIIFSFNLFNYVYKMSCQGKKRKRKLFLAPRHSVMKQLELEYHFAWQMTDESIIKAVNQLIVSFLKCHV